MLWIPVAFICAAACGFAAGTPEVTAQACQDMIAAMSLFLEQDPSVHVYHVQCLHVRLT